MSDLKHHPNNNVRAMAEVGHSLEEMLPAYPGHNTSSLEQLLRDCALALERPVINYGLLSIKPCTSTYFNVAPAGFRLGGMPQAWPPNKKKKNIFFFGGSTTAGFNIEDKMTVPAKLQATLSARGIDCEVYNFGSGNYTSRHEFLRFLGLVDEGHIPDYAIFLDGFNDSVYTFGNTQLVSALDELYQSEKRRRRSSYVKAVIDYALAQYQMRKKPLPSLAAYTVPGFEKIISELTCDNEITRALDRSFTPAKKEELHPRSAEIGQRVWESYLLSVSLIEELSKLIGVKTLYFWHPVPFFKTTPSQRILPKLFYYFRHSVFAWHAYHYLHSCGFSNLPQDLHFTNIDHIGELLDEILYIDFCHYSNFFAQVVADSIAETFLAHFKGEK